MDSLRALSCRGIVNPCRYIAELHVYKLRLHVDFRDDKYVDDNERKCVTVIIISTMGVAAAPSPSEEFKLFQRCDHAHVHHILLVGYRGRRN